MATDLVEINPDEPQPEVIARAATAIRRGEVIAIPSDALYTLMADPFNLRAVGRVFEAKGREPSRSLPLLITGVLMAEDLSRDLTGRFHLLARHFWPGPLTVIVPASAGVPLKVTGNTGRLAMRHSQGKVANALLEFLEQPLIATSANISGKPTCRSGIEVFGMMDGRLNLVLDGGISAGPGATTVDITEPWWRIIKQGGVSEKDIAEVLKGH
ncbi:MAG TPA: L-threonylcarbamoyladenylate synthase [Bryobacteraceae bacterium]|nr:L-threonylcarbamoyladenylate synthase [Bryobacteraceae bacterium]